MFREKSSLVRYSRKILTRMKVTLYRPLVSARMAKKFFAIKGLYVSGVTLASLLLWLTVSPVQALELGAISVESHLNEPLRAAFSLKNLGGASLEDVRVSLADRKTYRQFGLTRSSSLSKLKFTLQEGSQGIHTVRITSHQRIMEPIMEVLVRVTQKQNSLTRLYTLMVDPVDMKSLALENAMAPQELVGPNVAQLVSDDGEHIQQRKTSKKIEVRDKSISMIAQDSELHQKYSVYQIMRAFYLQNTSAFNKGNINFIKSGSLLDVPDEKAVAEVTRQQAINFVTAASRNFPFAQDRGQKKVKPIDKTPLSEPRQVIEVADEAESEASSAVIEDQEIQVSPEVKQDLTAWRGMTDEFKSLNDLLLKHNQAIRLQNEVMQAMDARMNSKNEDISKLVQRIDVLEASLKNMNPAQLKDAQGMQQVLLNQDLKIQKQQNAITRITHQLASRNEAFSSMGERLQLVENQNQLIAATIIGAQKTVVLGKEMDLFSINTRNTPDGISLLYSYKFWIFAGLTLALIIIVSRELLRRRHEAAPATVNTVTEKVAEHSRIKVTQDTPEEHPGVKTEFIQSKKKRSNVSLNSLGDVHTELDILIAYEHFDEAMELLVEARKDLKDDRWLDVKELEILAATKQVELFYARLEEMKESISREYPLAWKNILKLSFKLNEQHQHSASV